MYKQLHVIKIIQISSANQPEVMSLWEVAEGALHYRPSVSCKHISATSARRKQNESGQLADSGCFVNLYCNN